MQRAAFLLLIPLLFSRAFGQTGISTAEIRGKVTDTSGAALVFVTVSIESQNTGYRRLLFSGETGTYHALSLPPDIYIVRATLPGFETESKLLELSVGQTAVLDFRMSVGVRAGEFVEVIAEPDRSQQSNTITGESIQHLPIDKRNYLAYTLLMPGVADAEAMADANDYRPPQVAHSGLSFFGNNGRGNSVSVDGGEANDSGGGVRPTLSQEAVQEFQVNRSNYSVELGGASGGAINIVSRSGSNAFHGSVFGFFRHHAMDAADPFATRLEEERPIRVKPPSDRQQWGATFGGPLRTNRTFFFGAFERLRRREWSSVSVLTDPSIFEPTSQQERILAHLPSLRTALTSSETTRSLFRTNTGVFPYRSAEAKVSIRLDHAWNDSNQLIFRYSGARSGDSNPNTRALLGASRAMQTGRLDYTGLVAWTRTLDSRRVNQLQYQYNEGGFAVKSVEPFGPEINIHGFGYFNGDALLPSRMRWRRQHILEKLSVASGDHVFKIGGESLVRRNEVEAHTYFSGRFNFGSLPGTMLHPALDSAPLTAVQAFNLGIPQSYQQAFGNPTVASTEPFAAAYFEDRWRALPNLSLEWGLRYELDDLRDPIRTDKNNFAPRVAFAWDVRGSHRTTVRGGFGIFYAPSNYALVHVTNALGEVDGRRQIAQVLTTLGAPGPENAANIYQTLVAQNVIMLPAPTSRIQQSNLEQFGLFADVKQRPPLSIRFSNSSDYASAYTQQTSFGIQHAVGGNLVIDANYQFVSGLRILRSRDQNLLPVPVNPDLGIRVWSLASRDPEFFRDAALVQDNLYESTGRSFYHGMTLEVSTRLSPRIRLGANYTLSKAIDDVVDFNSDFQATDQLDLRAERALSSFDQRHKVVVHGSIEGFKGFAVSPVLRGNSGRPFNLLVGSDLNEDFHSTTDRPPMAGRNTGKGPGFWTVDLRLTRHVQWGERVKMELIGEAFNIFNQLNFRSVNNAVGLMAPPFDVRGRKDFTPSEPLAYTSAFDPRQVQLGVRVSF